MAIYSYRLARGQTRWMFTIDLPPAAAGRRRQMNRKGFVSQDAALAAETEPRKAYARADLAADGLTYRRCRPGPPPPPDGDCVADSAQHARRKSGEMRAVSDGIERREIAEVT